MAISELDLALDDVLKSIELNDFFVDYMKKDRELDGIRTLERYKKKSFNWYKEVIATNGGSLKR